MNKKEIMFIVQHELLTTDTGGYSVNTRNLVISLMMLTKLCSVYL